MKLLVCPETTRALDKEILVKAENGVPITLEVIVDTLVEIVKTARKEILNLYNQPNMMGMERSKVDLYFAKLGRDVSACKL